MTSARCANSATCRRSNVLADRSPGRTGISKDFRLTRLSRQSSFRLCAGGRLQQGRLRPRDPDVEPITHDVVQVHFSDLIKGKAVAVSRHVNSQAFTEK